MKNYTLKDCIDIFFYDPDPPEEFYTRCEQLMSQIFINLQCGYKLSVEDYIFLILCFGDKLSQWSNLCDTGSGGNGDVDFDSDQYEFVGKFIQEVVRQVIDPILRNYMERDVQKLSEGLSKMLNTYKNAKKWMIEKGYEV